MQLNQVIGVWGQRMFYWKSRTKEKINQDIVLKDNTEKDVEKDEEYKYTIYDIAIDESFIEENPSKTYEAVKEPFCNPCKEDGCYQTELYKPATQIKIHTARADRQNVTKDGSTIFRHCSKIQ